MTESVILSSRFHAWIVQFISRLPGPVFHKNVLFLKRYANGVNGDRLMRLGKPLLSICFLFMAHDAMLFSQPNLRFEEVSAINSLSQNTVKCMHQDKLGFLWLGTYNGLNKYDGYQFKVYNFNQKQADNTSSNRVSFIEEDNTGNLWLGTYDGRVHRFDPYKESFLSFPRDGEEEKAAQVNHYFESSHGFICLSTDKTGIYLIRQDTETNVADIRHITSNASGPRSINSNHVYFSTEDSRGNLWIGTANGLNRISQASLLQNNPVTERFFQDAHPPIHVTRSARVNETIWFGTQNNGVWCYDMGLDEFKKFDHDPIFQSLKETSITELVDNNNSLWIGTSNGTIVQYNTVHSRFHQYSFQKPQMGKSIHHIYVDHDNQVWIITEAFGITRLNPQSRTFRHYQLTPEKLKNLTDDERTVLFEDSRDRLWMGVQNVGVLYYDRQNDAFITYSNDPQDPHSLSSNIVECIYEDRTGNLWVGTSWFGKGLNKMIGIDRAFQYHRPVEKPANKIQNVVRSLFVDSEGYTWSGTKSGKVFIYNPHYQVVDVIEKNQQSGFTGHNVYTIYEDSQHHIWLGTKGGGIFRSNRPITAVAPQYHRLQFTRFKKETNSPGLNNNNIYDLVEDSLGRIWVATYGGGLNMIHKAGDNEYRFAQFTTANSALSNDKIRDLLLDSRGRLWVGSTYGLNYIDLGEDTRKLTVKSVISDGSGQNNLSYNDIMMMLEDRTGRIWLATAGGGTNVITNPAADAFIIKQITRKDGLKDDLNASLTEDQYGNIWIGTEHGISMYNPENKEITNFDQKNGLPVMLCSENTAVLTPRGELLMGTIDGFYSIIPGAIEPDQSAPNICLTSLQVNNKEVNPQDEDSPLEKSISYTDKITLRRKQANFTIAFAMLSFKSPESNQFSVMLEGFEDQWNYLGAEHKATYTNIPPGEYTFRVRNLNTNLAPNNPETVLAVEVLPAFWESWQAFVLYAVLIGLILAITLKITYRMAQLKNEVLVEHRVAESKLRFFTNVSHELRTPLTLILGPIEGMIARTGLPAEIKQQLDIVQRNAKRLQRTVNQLLDFRKVQNDKVCLSVREIDLVALINQIYEGYRELARQKNIRFDFYCDRDEIKIWGDAQKIDIVLFNLLSNAFKFTPDHQSISITVQEDSLHACVKVNDTGQGIPPDKLPYIFDRFFVSHTDQSTGQHGTGIGLSLSKKYVELHHGSITVESIPEEGTAFTVRLPKGKDHFKEGETEEQTQQPADPAPVIPIQTAFAYEPRSLSSTLENATHDYEILIVEDDPDMSAYVKSILSVRYKIREAKDGVDGLEKAGKHLPDLIIADIMMPGMDGIQLTQKLKDTFATSHIPVIMLTAKTETGDFIKGLDTGAEAYLPKPFNPQLLLSYVNTFIVQREKLKASFASTVELKPDEIRVAPQDKVFIERILQLIDAHLPDPEFNVEKLASMTAVSRTIFYKKIKGITGYQPIELIRMLRLKKAAQLLETGEFNVTEVAYKLGYNDVRYFSTSFKNQFGVSPSHFMKEKNAQA